MLHVANRTLKLMFIPYSNTAMVQFSPTTYTVTEGVDTFADLQLIRTGRLDDSSVVTVTTLQGTALGMKCSMKTTC